MDRKCPLVLLGAVMLVAFAASCAPPPPRAWNRGTGLVRPGRGTETPTLTERGIVEYRQGDLEIAEDLFEQAIGLYPNNPEAYYYLGEIRYRERRYDESLAFLYKAEIYFGPNDRRLAKVYLLMGRNDEAAGRAPQAAAHFRQTLALDPGNRDAASGLSRLLP